MAAAAAAAAAAARQQRQQQQSSVVARRLYRILLRQCAELSRCAVPVVDVSVGEGGDRTAEADNDKTFLFVHPPINPHEVGEARYFQLQKRQKPLTTSEDTARNCDDKRDVRSVLRLLQRSATAAATTRRRPSSANPSEDDEEEAEEQDDNDGDSVVVDNTNSNKNTALCRDDLVNEWLEGLAGESGTGDGDDKDEVGGIWTRTSIVRDAIRYAFRYAAPLSPTATAPMTTGAGDSITDDQRRQQRQKLETEWAIRAYRLLQGQASMQRCTSVSQLDNIRITATSRFIGRSIDTTAMDEESEDGNFEASIRYHFGYRIRVENLFPEDCESGTGTSAATPTAATSAAGASDSNGGAVQLLGRTWVIQQATADDGDDDGGYGGGGGNADDAKFETTTRVHAPDGGVVGHTPVLKPGQGFEYASFCDLGAGDAGRSKQRPSGRMTGCLHFRRCVSDDDSSSSTTTVSFVAPTPPTGFGRNDGNDDDAADDEQTPKYFFEVPIRPFALRF